MVGTSTAVWWVRGVLFPAMIHMRWTDFSCATAYLGASARQPLIRSRWPAVSLNMRIDIGPPPLGLRAVSTDPFGFGTCRLLGYNTGSQLVFQFET
jgi:hypothetical protein